MKEFRSPKAFAEHLVKLAATSEVVMAHAVKMSAEEIRDTAQGMIGQYQESIGPYPAWEQLADSTENDKARNGYPLEAPLLRTGELQKSISVTAIGAEAAVGTNDPVMEYHEFGTLHIPPRPVLGPSAMWSKARVEKIIGTTTLAWISGKGWIRPRIVKNEGQE